MLLALLALAIVAVALAVFGIACAMRADAPRQVRRRRAGRRREMLELRDPGRERRAEQRARELLRSCVNEEEWAMYRDLGFIRVDGRLARAADARGQGPVGPRRLGPGEPQATPDGPQAGASGRPAGLDEPDAGEPSAPGPGALRRRSARSGDGQAPYAYLIYPHKPIVAYVPATRRLLSEYCVEFPDLSGAVTGSRLPDSDDVLAKWMALTGDEERLLRRANMHLPGRQLDPGRVRRDLWRLAEWERRRRGSSPARAPRA